MMFVDSNKVYEPNIFVMICAHAYFVITSEFCSDGLLYKVAVHNLLCGKLL